MSRSAALLLVLNAVDAVSTTFFVTRGVATEANPFMALLLHVDPLEFLAFKLLIISAVIVWLQARGVLDRYTWLTVTFISIYFGAVGWHLYNGYLFFTGVS